MSEAFDDERFRALLEATHQFPGPYRLTVITRTDDAVVAALRVVITDQGLALPAAEDWMTQASGGGRYTSHRITLHCASAADVVALYLAVRGVTGVVGVM